MKKTELIDLKESKCTSCSGSGKSGLLFIKMLVIGKMTKQLLHLGNARSFNKGFIEEKKCTCCDGEGYLLAPI